MRHAWLDEGQAGIQSASRNINNLRYADETTLMAESEEELKSLLMKVKEESLKAGLKLSIQTPKIMVSGPTISWQKQWIQWEPLFSWTPKSLQRVIAAVKLKKKCLLLGRKNNLHSILKSKDITLLTQVHIVKAIVFSTGHIQMWELDGKEGCMPSNWCFWTGEDSWESFGLPGDQISQS